MLGIEGTPPVPNIKNHYLVNGSSDLLSGQWKSGKPLYLAFIKYDVFYP